MTDRYQQFNSDVFLLLNVFISTIFLFGIFSGVLLAVLEFLKYFLSKRESYNYRTYLVKLPRDNDIKIDSAEQMFASLHTLHKSGISSLFKRDSIVFEIGSVKDDISFYFSVKKDLADFVKKQIYGVYPQASIEEVPELNIFSKEGYVAFTSLVLEKKDFYPIKTYKELTTDPMLGITSTLANFSKNEGARIQYIISPVGSSLKGKADQYITSKKEKIAKQKLKDETFPVESEKINSKVLKPLFKVSLRIVVSAETKVRAEAHVKNIAGSFGQFSGQNSFKTKGSFLSFLFMKDFIYKIFSLFSKNGFILNSEELATIFHFPNKDVTTHNIRWLTAKTAPAPPQIPTSGLYIGKSIYRGKERKVYLRLEDRRRHIYIVGKTGTGKSELLKDMILQDIANGHGVCAIDPHGEFVEDILQLMDPRRAEDVIYFNPTDTQMPIGINIMEARTEKEKYFVISSIIALMYKLYDPHRTGIIGPRFEHAIRNAMLTVMSKGEGTFIEVVRVLTDKKFRDSLLPYVKDPIVKRYWTDQIANTSQFHISEVLDYIVSKFGPFITNKTIRNIIGQSKSSFDFRKAMDSKKIMLFNLAKGALGEEDAKFLGLIIIPKLLIAAMSRQDVPMEQRTDFFMYVDEFQNYATQDFATIFSEARKYRLNLTVANQFITQVNEDVKNAIFGNVGTLMTFRLGVPDAMFIEKEFQPIFNASDLVNIEKYNIYMKTIVDNEPLPPFSVSLKKDMEKIRKRMDPELAKVIKEISRLKYGRPKNLVDKEIALRAKL